MLINIVVVNISNKFIISIAKINIFFVYQKNNCLFFLLKI